MIRRGATLTAAFLVLASLAALASLKEVRWSADLATDRSTGAPAVYFSVILEYAPLPKRVDLTVSWTVYALVDGKEVATDSPISWSSQDPSMGRIGLMSPPVAVETGKTYGAHLVVQDTVNGFTYRRDFQYLAPLVLPIGLRLEGWDGSSGMDLTGLADEELEELVTLYNHLKTYVEAASEQALETFLTASLPAEEGFPAVVLLVPFAGLSTTYGSAQGVTLTVNQVFVMYVIPSADGIPALRAQVAGFDQPILGATYAGSGDLGILTARRAFADETAWAVLVAASSEWAKRTN